MANMSLEKTKMPMQEPEERIHNFDEVAFGYDEVMAINEANRCLHCLNRPCVDGCPIHNNIPEFIEHIKNKDYEGAYDVISTTSLFPSICGRVCSQEVQCESKCTRGIKGESVSIGRLERFVGDIHYSSQRKQTKPLSNNHSVGLVGSGPSSIACAYELAKKGFDVAIYEALDELGGVLMYGIPDFRLPKKYVQRLIDDLKDLGVNFITNTVIGKDISIEELLKKHDALYIATGVGESGFMNIEGETLDGVYSANDFLMRVHKDESKTPFLQNKKVIVVGGGNVAMDVARTAIRLGSESVNIVYRRSMEELPSRKEEVEHTLQEKVELKLLNNPKRIIGENGKVKAVECIKMELGELDERGRRKPIEIKGSEFIIEADVVIMAIGSYPNDYIKYDDLKTNKGYILIDDNGMTSVDNVYAGGDIVSGPSTVINAVKAGKKAAQSIIKKTLNN